MKNIEEIIKSDIFFSSSLDLNKGTNWNNVIDIALNNKVATVKAKFIEKVYCPY